jgi:hypothetical protein
MVKLLIEFEAADFAKWKAAFDSNEGARKNAGIKNIAVYRGVEKPTALQLLVEVEDEKKGMAFFTSPELRDLQVKSGVLGKPMSYRLNAI